jgi:hypothetical protein
MAVHGMDCKPQCSADVHFLSPLQSETSHSKPLHNHGVSSGRLRSPNTHETVCPTLVLSAAAAVVPAVTGQLASSWERYLHATISQGSGGERLVCSWGVRPSLRRTLATQHTQACCTHRSGSCTAATDGWSRLQITQLPCHHHMQAFCMWENPRQLCALSSQRFRTNIRI